MYLQLFLLCHPEKGMQSVQHFGWGTLLGQEAQGFIELLYFRVKEVFRRKRIVLSGRLNELLEQGETSELVPRDLLYKTLYMRDHQLSYRTQLRLLNRVLEGRLFEPESDFYANLKPVLRL